MLQGLSSWVMCSWRQAVLNRAAVVLGVKGTDQARGSGNCVAPGSEVH